MYFAVRSDRDRLPVLIWPTPVATARSAMNVSSVSPDRCEITDAYPADRAVSIASSVSVSVPIWLTFMSIALAIPSAIPFRSRSVLVTNRSSPTSCTLEPSVSVSAFQPAQSSSASPSSIERIGQRSHQSA